MNKNHEFNLTAIYSGNGESGCLAIDKDSFKKIYENQGMINDDFPIEDWYETNQNRYVKMTNGDELFDLPEYGLLDMFFVKRYYRDFKNAVGFRAKVFVEPIFENEIIDKSNED